MEHNSAQNPVQQDTSIPVITIDGLAGTGKGTARMRVAARLGFNELDSGVLYRALALVCHEKNISPENEAEHDSCANEAIGLNVEMTGEAIIIDGKDRTRDIRSPESGKRASVISKIKSVREKLHTYQLSRRKTPGLVADGRDQGYIFDTKYRFVLTARPEVRAERRVIEFAAAGHPANYEEILADIIRRDHSDMTRAVSPFVPHPEAIIIDTSDLTRDEVADAIIAEYEKNRV
jgi:cytidylate kinase